LTMVESRPDISGPQVQAAAMIQTRRSTWSEASVTRSAVHVHGSADYMAYCQQRLARPKLIAKLPGTVPDS
jgi:hypothetical protein